MNKKYKIIALFGPAGSGKDHLLNNILKTQYGKQLNRIIPFTTRSKRDKQKEGVNYHFITKETFFLHDKYENWIEYADFNGWYYGTSKTSLQPKKINIGIFNIRGIQQLLDNKEIECIPIYISCPGIIRLLRQLTRQDNPNCHQICRRYLSDEQDFIHIPFEYTIVKNQTKETQPVINDLIKIIQKGQNDLI